MPLKAQPKFIESISVRDFYESFRDPLKLNLIAGEKGLKGKIRDNSINRPSLVLTGFYRYFAAKRLQLFGAGEMGYLRALDDDRQRAALTEIAIRHIPCIVVSRNLAPTAAMLEVARKFKIPLMRTPLTSRDFTTTAVLLLEEKFAPRVMEHGTMMDVRGIGTLIRGGSGIGKSECALALIEHGHSLVADDSVHIRLINERELMATGSELNRGYMECRGLGIINVAELFGIRAVRLEKRIDMVVTFAEWAPGMEEERTGLEENYYEILGRKITHIELPVRSGRDLARLVEVASMVKALKGIGHDPAREFNERLIEYMSKPDGEI